MKLVSTLLTMFIYTVSMTTLAYGQELSEPYIFRVLPGTSEWKKFNNHSDMIDSSQMPVNLIKKY